MMAGSPVQDTPIAILAHTHPSLTKGGAEIASYSLYQGLLDMGYDAVFIAACPYRDQARLALGSLREFAVFYDPLQYDHFYHLAMPTIWEQLRHIFETQKIGIANYHHFMNFGINTIRESQAMPGLRTAVTLHEFLAICNHHGQMVTRPDRRLCEESSPFKCAGCFPEMGRKRFELRHQLLRSVLEQADSLISPSHFLARRFVTWGCPDRIEVIENSPLIAPAAGPAPTERGESPVWNFGYFGQITPFKGVDILLQAIELIGQMPELAKTVRITIYGGLVGQSAEFTEAFKAAVAKHTFLHYHGPYDNGSVQTLMMECDYAIVPSTWWENSPVVIQEAYRAGLPVVCSGIGGMAEKVRDGVTGLHFRMGSAAALVQVIGRAADAAMHAKLRAALPRIGEPRDMALDYLKVFERLAQLPPKVAVAPPAPAAEPAPPEAAAAEVAPPEAVTSEPPASETPAEESPATADPAGTSRRARRRRSEAAD